MTYLGFILTMFGAYFQILPMLIIGLVLAVVGVMTMKEDDHVGNTRRR